MVCQDEFDNLFGGMHLGPDLVIEIVPAERRLEDIGPDHIQVLLNIVLHLRSSSCC